MSKDETVRKKNRGWGAEGALGHGGCQYVQVKREKMQLLGGEPARLRRLGARVPLPFLIAA